MRAWILLLGWLAVSGCAGTGVAATLPAPLPHALSTNKRAAAQDAQRLLRTIRLPAGAARVAHEPAGDHGWLRPLESILASEARAGAHAWWEVPGAPSSVLGYVESHPPTGATRFASGSGGDRSGSTERNVSYSWPALPGVLTARLLQVTVTALPGGRTGVLAQAQSDWLVPRPASERVPAGVRSIVITERLHGGPTVLTRTVTSAPKIHQIVALFDGLPIVQPEVMNCPALIVTGAHVTSVRFRGAASQTLAEASYTGTLPGASGQCNPVTFTVRGRRQTPLIGGDFLRRLARIVGAALTG